MDTIIGCSVVIYDRCGKVLIAKRSGIKKHFPLMWETVGGALEDNETPEECIRRETKEEIGCDLYDLQLFQVNVIREGDNRHVHIVYTGRIEDEIEPNCEIEETKWITREQIDGYKFCAAGCRKKVVDFFNENRGVANGK